MDGEKKGVYDENPDQDINNRNCESDPGSNDENTADNEYFIKKAVFRNYEVSINGTKPGNPAEMLEKLYPLSCDNTMTNEEKSEQLRRIILEYME